ncbi:hypothetical protein [Streptomyces sp. NPDC031705]|uniref:hypothetical protein n=1 Tax=Streptomyces sp. NPDC031705 TaxID=3155729 RepID=UPI0033C9B1A8
MALDDPHPLSRRARGAVDARAAKAAPPRSPGDPARAEPLPCGRPLGRAWQQARDPLGALDPHTARCPYCREAVEGLAALDRATRALRAEERPPAPGLADRVIEAVRTEVRLGAVLLLDDPGRGLRIAESAAAKALRRAADTVPGARAASCRLTPLREDRAAHLVTLTLAVAVDQPLRERAERVRQAVLQAADHVLGLAVAAVDLEIDAVLDLPRVPGRRRAEPSPR